MSRLTTNNKKRAFAAFLCYAAFALRPVDSFSSPSTRDFRFTSTSRLLESYSSSDGGEGTAVETLERRRQRGWRGVGRWLTNRRKRSSKRSRSEELYMVATPIALEKTTTKSIPDFIRENMDKMSPDRVLPSSTAQESLWNTGAELEAVLVEERREDTEVPTVDSPARGRPSLASKKAGYGVVGRITRNWLTSTLTERLTERWTVVPPEDVTVDVTPIGPNVGARMTRGRYLFDVAMDYAGSLVFPCIQSSGGGVIRAKHVCLNLASFFGSNDPKEASSASSRFAEPFELSFENCVLTKKDWLESNCIRNGLSRLLKRVVRKNTNLRPNAVQINRLNILPDRKLSCEAVIMNGSVLELIPLEIRTWFDVQNRGHVVKLRGLELSSPFLPTLKHDFSTLVVDIGHDAMFEHITLNPDEQTLTFSGSVRIQPSTNPTLQQQQSRDSYYAQCFVDVGAWFTKLVENLTVPQPPATKKAE